MQIYFGREAAAASDSVDILIQRVAAAPQRNIEMPLMTEAAAASDSDDMLFHRVAAALPSKMQIPSMREAAALCIK